MLPLKEKAIAAANQIYQDLLAWEKNQSQDEALAEFIASYRVTSADEDENFAVSVFGYEVSFNWSRLMGWSFGSISPAKLIKLPVRPGRLFASRRIRRAVV
jgi:hypothetical protein